MDQDDLSEVEERYGSWTWRGKRTFSGFMQATYWPRLDLQDPDLWAIEIRYQIYLLLKQIVGGDDLDENRALGISAARLTGDDFSEPAMGTEKIADPKVFPYRQIVAAAADDALWDLSEDMSSYIQKQYEKGKNYDFFALYLLQDWFS